MVIRKSLVAVSLGGLILTGLGLSALAQEGDRPRFDPAELQQRRMERFKEQLKASDEEWKALSPKVEKVLSAQRDTLIGGGFGGFGGGRGGRGGPGGRGGERGGDRGGDNAPQTPVAKATSALRTALEDEKTGKEDIAKHLASLRDERAKSRETLVSAQKDLKELLTQRQEATLVLSGIID